MEQPHLKLISKILNLASDDLSNNGCNDIEDEFFTDISVEEKRKMFKELHDWNKTPEDYDPTDLWTSDWLLAKFLAHKVDELIKK